MKSLATEDQIRNGIDCLFVESYPHAIAGQQRTLSGLLGQATQNNWVVKVLVPGSGKFVEYLLSQGIDVEICEQPPLINRYGGAIYRDGIPTRIRLFFQIANYIYHLWQWLGIKKPKVVFCNDMRALFTVGVAAKFRGLPVAIWDKLDKPHGLLDQLQLPIANLNLIISNAVANKYPIWQRRWLGDRIRLAHDGIDVTAFKEPKSIRENLKIDKNDIVLGIVGSVMYRKGHDRLLAIWKDLSVQCPEALLLIIGEPASAEDRTWAENLPNAIHTRVRWLGEREDIPLLMQTIDILVVPSRHEGMGRVCVEAMVAGKPVVGARTGGIPEVIIDNETGMLFDGNNLNDLKEKLITLCGNRELRETLGKSGRQRAETEFNASRQHSLVLDYLSALAKAN